MKIPITGTLPTRRVDRGILPICIGLTLPCFENYQSGGKACQIPRHHLPPPPNNHGLNQPRQIQAHEESRAL